MEEKIKNYIKAGFPIDVIQLRCGNPSRKWIRELIKETDPYMYSILGDTKKIKQYRDWLYKKNGLLV